MNFNFSNKAEYTLNTTLTSEMINLYGIPIKFLVTEKINSDDLVFGDYSHLKSNSNKIYEMWALPDQSDDWESSGYNMNTFGLVNFDNINLYVMKSNFDATSSFTITNADIGVNTPAGDGDTGWLNSWNVITEGAVDAAEVTEVFCHADDTGSLNNTYWTLSSPSTDYYVWYNVNSMGVDPEIVGRTGIEVQINTDALNGTVANATKSAIDNIDDFTVTMDPDHDEISEIAGNLVILPNNKIMEITDADFVVPGVNNLFTYNDVKSVYKLTCKPYDFKLINELAPADLSVDDTSYETLDNYFSELTDTKEAQDDEADTTEQVPTIDQSEDPDVIVNEPIVDKTVSSPFGEFD